jgi:hypothetical protein
MASLPSLSMPQSVYLSLVEKKSKSPNLINPNYAVGGEAPQFSREAELSALVGFTSM